MRSFIVAFACGVMLLQIQGALPPVELVGVLAAAGATLPFIVRRMRGKTLHLISPYVSVLCGFLIGFSWAAGMAHYRLSDVLPEEWETKTLKITGIVATLPMRFAQGERFEFDVESVQTSGVHAPERIFLSWYRSGSFGEEADAGKTSDATGETTVVHPGERWQLSVRLRRPHGNANPHGFDYEAWLLERNLRATGSVRAREENQRLDAFVPRPAYIVQHLRDRVRERFLSALPDAPYLGVLVALAIGDQRSITSGQWETFRRTGITHLVSISGLHVTMVAALLGLLVNGLWRRSTRLMLWIPAQKASLFSAWFAAGLYSLLAGFEVPAQRTFYMLTVVTFSLLSARNSSIGRTLLLALLIALILDPWAVLAPGFWLSFGAVALLFFVGNSRVVEQRGWRATLAQWGIAQWGVTLGSLPLLLLFFQQFSLVSPLANALAIPFVSFLVTPLALLFAVVPWTPLLQLDHWLLTQLMIFIEILASWPVWQQASPPFWAIMLAIPGVVWMLLPRGFPGRYAGIFLLFPTLFFPSPRPASGEAWVDVLDVGQGLAVVVRTAGHTLLYDTGPLYGPESNAGTRILVPFLNAVGVHRIDALVVSHKDKDHAGGMDAVRLAFPVERLLSSMEVSGGERCLAGQSWEWDGVRFNMLYPQPEDYAIKSRKSNNLSCVLRISAASESLLLTGDIESADEKRLIDRIPPEEIRSTLLSVPHHGSRSSSSWSFVAAVAARETIFSAGYRNAFRHPRPEILARYASSRIWRTDRDGAIRLVLSDSPHASAWRQKRQRYWSGR